MEATGEAMIITPRLSNKLFDCDGEVYIYWSLTLRTWYCKKFGHSKINFDEWHCDRCHVCLEHDNNDCEY